MQIYTNFESNSQLVSRCLSSPCIVSDANLHKFWKQFTTDALSDLHDWLLFPMQIYTNFESNSQRIQNSLFLSYDCFRCKFTQILKAIHNEYKTRYSYLTIVSDANLHKFWKQFTTLPHLTKASRGLFPMQIYTNFESNSQRRQRPDGSLLNANLHKFWKQFTTRYDRCCVLSHCFRCKFTQILKAIHNRWTERCGVWIIVSDANLHKFWKQFTTVREVVALFVELFPMQIYTNFESNSQRERHRPVTFSNCFRCKFTQILKAIHNGALLLHHALQIVSDANLHKFWKQFTTRRIWQAGMSELFPMQIYTNFESNSQPAASWRGPPPHCFRCKFTQILKAIHNSPGWACRWPRIVSDANLHKFWKQFTTELLSSNHCVWLFPMQIYTNFESNSQPTILMKKGATNCFRCKFTQILKAIHNLKLKNRLLRCIVSDANLHKFWKQFTTNVRLEVVSNLLFPMQIYTNFESNSQLKAQEVFEPADCFRCKFTQILKAIHNPISRFSFPCLIVSDANLHKFWKQFTTLTLRLVKLVLLFPMQIYTNFESNSQLITVFVFTTRIVSDANLHKFWKQFTTQGSHKTPDEHCFRCKFTQILKAIHNIMDENGSYYGLFPMQIYTNFESNSQPVTTIDNKPGIVSDANLHKFWKQFTTLMPKILLTCTLFPMQIYTNFESNSQLITVFVFTTRIVSDANLHKFWKQFTTQGSHKTPDEHCFRCKFTQILKAIHNIMDENGSYYGLFPMQIYTNFESNSQPVTTIDNKPGIVSDANLHKFWKQFTTLMPKILLTCTLFPMQIYTNFESNSQRMGLDSAKTCHCFRCKFTQILKAIHNYRLVETKISPIVSDANLHKFWKQFTTGRSFESAGKNCFRCKFTQILKAIHNRGLKYSVKQEIVSDANLHKFWKQFTTRKFRSQRHNGLFPMQIYTNFESNSQLENIVEMKYMDCFRCKFTQILKAIHNRASVSVSWIFIVSDANLHKFWKQFTTGGRTYDRTLPLFPMQIYTNFESNSQQESLGIGDSAGLFPMQIYTNFESNSQLW